MSQMLKSSGAMGAATLTSRLLGLVREIAYTSFMGTSWVADAFNLAFMVPNLFRRLLGEGALTAAFIPIFKEKEKLEGETKMWHAANAVTSALIAATSVVVVIGMTLISVLLFASGTMGAAFRMAIRLEGFMPIALGASLAGLGLRWLGRRRALPRSAWWTMVGAAWICVAFVLMLLAFGGLVLQHSGGGKTLLMLRLLRVMFPYLLLVCLAAAFMGMLNARGHFFVPALGAAMLNVVMIASVWWLAPKMGIKLEDQVFGLAVGVVVAGLAQAGFQGPLLHREGFQLRWVNPWHEPTVQRVIKQMIPGTIGVAAFQINVLLTQCMGFWVGEGVVASFGVAVRLMELPQGVFGISLATYLLPTLSGMAAEKKYAEFRSTLSQGLGWLIFINLLAAALLFTLAEPIIRLLFERRMFDEASTDASALALRCLAPGLVAFSVVNVLARAFFALGDTHAPMRISVFCLALNVGLAAILVPYYKQGGLGSANTISAVLNMALLFYALRKKLKRLELAAVRKDLPALIGAAVVAGLAAWVAAWQWEMRLGHRTLPFRIGEVFVPMTLAAALYIGIATWTGVEHVQHLKKLIRGRFANRE
ncbi:MAG TPA: murein biosynthesis integral membrane protein MurJ [Candidatus Dormibacteraeota bacterium]|nr:murein biosynthesis integral membrane protein MurJ [Candidatus Dormibacteraeota bacterium]